jgi:hypothetical protein
MASEVFVYTMTSIGGVGAWSRYVFPFTIEAFARLGEQLYIRAGDDVLRLSRQTAFDYTGDPRAVPVEGSIQWPWLEFGQLGRLKKMVGFDLTAEGSSQVSVGPNQSQPAAFTRPCAVPPDSVPGNIIPMPVMAPSFSIRVEFLNGQQWEWKALNVYLADQKMLA